MKNFNTKIALFLFAILFFAWIQPVSGQVISTFAGDYRRSNYGYSGDGSPATNAQMNVTNGMAFDNAGNLYIADVNNNRIRKVDAITRLISTFAGTGTAGNTGDNGLAIAATFNKPFALATDKNGNLYVADQSNVIRKIDIVTTVIKTVAGNGTQGFSGDNGPATDASLNYPVAFACDNNNNLFIADQGNRRVRRVDGVTHVITTYAGTGQNGTTGDNGDALSAKFITLSGLAIDGDDNIYITDRDDYKIRKISAGTNIIVTYAGTGAEGLAGDNGPALDAKFVKPGQLTFGKNGNLYLIDFSMLRVIDTTTKVIMRYAGSFTQTFGNIKDTEQLLTIAIEPEYIASDGNYLYFSSFSHVLKINDTAGLVINYAGNYTIYAGDGGSATQAVFNSPRKILFDTAGNLLVADENNGRVRSINIQTNEINTIAGGGDWPELSEDTVTGLETGFSRATALLFDSANNLLGCDEGQGYVWKMNTVTNKIYVIAGGGSKSGEEVTGVVPAREVPVEPKDIALDKAGNLYIVDYYSDIIWEIDHENNIGYWFCGKFNKPGYAGDGGLLFYAKLNHPTCIRIDKAGNFYVADAGNYRVRKISHDSITTIAGNGISGYSGDGGPATGASIGFIDGLTIDSANNLYIEGEGSVRRIDAITGIITTVVGQGSTGYAGDGGLATNALLNGASCMEFDKQGNMYAADRLNNVIRKVTASPLPITLYSFIATKAGKYARLNWQTASEINSSYFSIERSSDGAHFSAIGQVAAAGKSTQMRSYQFNDLAPLQNLNYYRLKQFDKDGRYSYSPIAVVNFDGLISLRLSPNPVKNVVTVSGLPVAAKSVLSIIDNNGKTVRTYNVLATDFAVNTSYLTAGIYYLKVETGKKVTTLKFIKE